MAPQDARNATVMASPMRSIIPGLRARTSPSAPVRKGHPPHRYMTVPSRGGIPVTHGESGRVRPSIIAKPRLRATVGTARTSMIQKSLRNRATWAMCPPWPV